MFLAGILLLVSCRPTNPSASIDLDSPVGLDIPDLSEQVVEAIPLAGAESAGEVNECLACHTRQERLVATAEQVEEVGEGESSGVG